jgi:hypothetical protein
MTIRKSLQGICTQFPDIKYLAQKSIICQLKSLYHRSQQKHDLLSQINLKELAFSHGLIQVPKISLKNQKASQSMEDEIQEQPLMKGNKKSRKLEKLKRKIKLKKERMKSKNTSLIDDKFLTKNMDDQLNELRENPMLTRGKDIIKMDDQPSEDFLKKKEGPVIIEKLDLKKVKLSKRKFQKIKHEGPFGGKNIKEIDNEGNLVDKSKSFKEKFKGGPMIDRVGQFKSKLGK